MATVVSFPDTRMTEAEYRRAREELRATYGEGGGQAHAHADQALAALFVRSGWTQGQLAAAEGTKPRYIAYRLTFGRFLGFCTTVQNPDFVPVRAALTERRFRTYWLRARGVGSGNERQRFLAVQQALLQDLRIGRSTQRKEPIGKAIKATCADGKWRLFSSICERVHTAEPAATVEDIRTVLEWMVQRGTYGLTAEKQKGAKEWRYKLLVSGRSIPLEALMQELGPIIKGLYVEGRKSHVTASPPTVLHLTFQLEQVLERLTKER